MRRQEFALTVRDRIRICSLAVSGEVLSGGNDWQRARSDSRIELDVRLLLKTTEDALTDLPAVIRALDRAEIFNPASFYFSLSGLFETNAPPYDWLKSSHRYWYREPTSRRAYLHHFRSAVIFGGSRPVIKER